MPLIKKYPKYATQIKQFYTGWPQMLKGEIAGTHDIVDKLKKAGVKVYGLTNWSAETFPIAYKRFEVFHKLDGIVVSGEEKCVKPGKEIFNRLLSRFNLRAADCIFIDDNSDNIATAKELGFDTILFQNAKELQIELNNKMHLL